MMDDPTQNYTMPQDDAYGLNIPEYTFAQLIGFALQQVRSNLHSPDNLVDQLFRRQPESERNSIKKWLLAHQSIGIYVNWPPQDVKLPFIALVTEGASEAEELALLGDVAGIHTLGMGNGGVELFKVADTASTNIIIASEEPRISLYLAGLVRYVFLRNKLELIREADIHNLRVSHGDLRYDVEYFPTFAYMRQVTLQYNTFFDINVTTKASLSISLSLMVSTVQDGEIVTTEVPNT